MKKPFVYFQILLATITKYIADCPNLITEDMFNVMKAEQLKVYYNTFLKPGKLVKYEYQKYSCV